MAKQKENNETNVNEKFHIYDFIMRTNANKMQQDVFQKKFANGEVKTLIEWEKATGKKILEIFK